MSKFTLLNPEGNIPYSKIVQGKKWVGRVYPKADGTYGAVLNGNPLHVTADTRLAAFELIVARHFGFNSVEDLRDNNRAVRAANRMRNAHAKALVNQFFNATTYAEKQAVLDEVFGG